MKNVLKKLRISSNKSENSDGSLRSKGNSRFSDVSSTESFSRTKNVQKPFSAISRWLNYVTSRRTPNPPSSSNATSIEKTETFDSVDGGYLEAALDAVRHDSESSNLRDPDIEEEYQIQLALALSAREDPEAVQIEAVKQISLGTCPPENTPAEVASFRYWNYNALSYDDKILDGFYDIYGIIAEPTLSRMPSLIDLQGTPVSNDTSWEAILVNREVDNNLLKLEQKALNLGFKLKLDSVNFTTLRMVQNLAVLVSDHMGGPVSDPDRMLIEWRNVSNSLKTNRGSIVFPLGSLTVGLARHRALLFKILADIVDIPCRLLKGQEVTGSDEAVLNVVKIEDGREYIVDLMADPGTIIPCDTAVVMDASNSHNIASSSGRMTKSSDGQLENKSMVKGDNAQMKLMEKRVEAWGVSNVAGSDNPVDVKDTGPEIFGNPCHTLTHARYPSWTEGVSNPAARRMKVKDVSQLMIDATKENPELAQKLHDVLLESGVVAPPNLFSDIYPEKLEKEAGVDGILPTKNSSNFNRASQPFLPHISGTSNNQLECKLDVENLSGSHPSEYKLDPSNLKNNVPAVAAAAAAAAVAVASSMAVAAANANKDPRLNLPVIAAATATATAAVVVATTAVSKKYEILETASDPLDSLCAISIPAECLRSAGVADMKVPEFGVSARELEGVEVNSEGEQISDRSVGNESSKSDTTLNDVADCEIPWEDISMGERIGLGSYGEVYRGDWHGTEVAVKRFLDQDIAGESLEDFRSEIRIMKKLRHPNVVLFMGAVTRPPNLSIVTEFLPRGSLYRLIHRPNSQLDERRRLRMALDAARGLNYLHNCTPMVVHRDLKSPNLLVDKNWVVKVCDFGLSRMKHSTYLSSRSTSGTAEWMAPEVLRNEPSNEKCDVYSFGVILWELFTLQQPWGGMNPMQVVGAVGFQHRRLDIPSDMDPVVADIIRQCWLTDPKLRPSFAEIMAALKPLQKPITSKQRT